MCVWEGEEGVGEEGRGSWENKCDESMWIIVCGPEGTYGHDHRDLKSRVSERSERSL